MKFIRDILEEEFPEELAREIYDKDPLIFYLRNKTRAANRSSKSRGSLANLYALYVLIEDYIENGYLYSENYFSYEGMQFSKALNKIHQLPYGSKIQNHALNDRCNDEFKKFNYEITSEVPIIRDLKTKRYWINEKLLKVTYNNQELNLAPIVLQIIDKYIELRTANFHNFFNLLLQQKELIKTNPETVRKFLVSLIQPNVDARLFEIVSYVIIKFFYIEDVMHYTINDSGIYTAKLTVFKTGRTNANDGGIDYIMKPLGRVFQVTETLNFKKYFLDIDKLEYYPITFVIKTEKEPEEVIAFIHKKAQKIYSPLVINKYLACFEEIITIPTLLKMLDKNIAHNYLNDMVDEMILQSTIEYSL